jgi:hypothetical protein
MPGLEVIAGIPSITRGGDASEDRAGDFAAPADVFAAIGNIELARMV